MFSPMRKFRNYPISLRSLLLVALAFTTGLITRWFFQTSSLFKKNFPTVATSTIVPIFPFKAACFGPRNSQNGSNRLNETYWLLTSLYEKDKLDFQELEAYPLSDDVDLSDLSKEILRDEPLQDLSGVADHLTSTIGIVEPNDRALRQGDTLKVRVDLRDSQGGSVHKGGHEVRVWMADKSQGLSAAAEVHDLRNGSYLAAIPLLWPGNATVFAALMRPREYKHIVLEQLRKRKTSRPVLAGFIKGNVSETTVCMPYPIIPCYHDVCNFTSENGGLPWYCGKPLNQGLSCDDWTVSRLTKVDVQIRAGSTQEVQLQQKIRQYSDKERSIIHLPQTVNVNVTEGSFQTNNLPCYQKPPRETWSDQSPHGYWQGRQWRHLKCALPALSQDFVHRCVRDKTFVMPGDSNALAILEKVAQLSGCPMRVVNPTNSPITMHLPKVCHNAALNFSQEWHPHAYPFVNVDNWALRRYRISPAETMAKIPATGDFVILVHLYMHFLWSDSRIYAMHVRDTARGVRELLARKPRTKVVIRGPHPWNGLDGDFHGLRSFYILRKEFQGLEDQVVFLNVWDMNVANENLHTHPEDYVVDAMANIFLGLICS